MAKNENSGAEAPQEAAEASQHNVPIPPSPVQPAGTVSEQADSTSAPQPASAMMHPSGSAPQPQPAPQGSAGEAAQTGRTPGAAQAIPPGSGPVSPNTGQYSESTVPHPDGYRMGVPGQPRELSSTVGPDGKPLPPIQGVANHPAHPADTQVAPRDVNQRTVWIFVNRNPFVVHLPHPNDPGSTVMFPPCPDRSKPLGMLDFRTHPFFSNFVGFKRSISQEAAPEYLKLRPESVEGAEESQSPYDLMRMSPDRIAEYINWVKQSNPEIAAQITRALASSGSPQRQM